MRLGGLCNFFRGFLQRFLGHLQLSCGLVSKETYQISGVTSTGFRFGMRSLSSTRFFGSLGRELSTRRRMRSTREGFRSRF